MSGAAARQVVGVMSSVHGAATMCRPVITTLKPVALGSVPPLVSNDWAAIVSTAWVSAAAASPVAISRCRGQRPEGSEYQLGRW